MTTAAPTARPRTSTLDVGLRVLAAVGLGISAYVHLHLAHRYATVPHDTIGQDDLFYVQGVLAAAVGLWLLVTGMRLAWWVAALVGAGSFAAVLLYRYVDVGAIGPLPNMNDASWQPTPDKALSAIAEAGVVVMWLLHEITARVRRT